MDAPVVRRLSVVFEGRWGRPPPLFSEDTVTREVLVVISIWAGPRANRADGEYRRS